MRNSRKPLLQLWAEKKNGFLDTIISDDFEKGLRIGFFVIIAIGIIIYLALKYLG